MQVDGSRYYRVKAVAEMLDVSPSTIYRAIESGELDALKIGTGKGTIRISGRSLSLWLASCSDASYEAYVEAGASPEDADENGALTPAQADGRACVVCGHYFEDYEIEHEPVGFGPEGGQVFACSRHADKAGEFAEEVSA